MVMLSIWSRTRSFPCLTVTYMRNLDSPQIFEMFGGGRFRIIQSTTEEIQLKNTNVESYHVGGKWHFAKALGILFAMEGDVRNTAYTNNIYNQGQAPDKNIILGDDGCH